MSKRRVWGALCGCQPSVTESVDSRGISSARRPEVFTFADGSVLLPLVIESVVAGIARSISQLF